MWPSVHMRVSIIVHACSYSVHALSCPAASCYICKLSGQGVGFFCREATRAFFFQVTLLALYSICRVSRRKTQKIKNGPAASFYAVSHETGGVQVQYSTACVPWEFSSLFPQDARFFCVYARTHIYGTELNCFFSKKHKRAEVLVRIYVMRLNIMAFRNWYDIYIHTRICAFQICLQEK